MPITNIMIFIITIRKDIHKQVSWNYILGKKKERR